MVPMARSNTPADELTQGSNVEVDMVNGQQFKGRVMMYDTGLDWFVLMEETATGLWKRLINIHYVRQVRGTSTQYAAEIPDLGSDADLLQNAMIRLQSSMEEKARLSNKDISCRGFDTFSELKKLFNETDVIWEGAKIKVMDTVLIENPYGPSDCTALNDEVKTRTCLERIKKVLTQRESAKDTRVMTK